MARTIYPIASESAVSFSVQTTHPPQPAGKPAVRAPMQSLAGGKSAQQARQRTADEQTYLERVQNYIPAEIVAIFIFVNSLITEPRDDLGAITSEGWVALASVAICLVACFVFARVAAAQAEIPTHRLQGWMFVIALLIWIYALDAKVLEVINHEPIPALSGLLLVTFTVFSGLVVPGVKAPDPALEQEEEDEE